MRSLMNLGQIQWAIVVIVVASCVVMGVEAKEIALSGVAGLVGVLVGESNAN